MLYLNTIIISGNLTRDPVLKYSQKGDPVLRFSIANNRNYKDKNEEWQTETSFFEVVAFGKTAEFSQDRLGKGMEVVVEGKLKQDKYEKSGTPMTRIEIRADRITPTQRLNNKLDIPPKTEPTTTTTNPDNTTTPTTKPKDPLDDLPF